LVTFVDISARKQAEEAVRASEQRLLRMVNVPRVGVMTLSHPGSLLHVNDALLEILGYGRPEFESKARTWRDFTPPEYVVASERIMQELNATGRGGPYEKEYYRKNGSRVWLMFVAADLGDGTIVEYAIDISDRKQAELALRASEEQFRRAIQDAPNPVIMQAEDGQVLQISHTWTELTGYTLADVPTAEAWLTQAYGAGADAVRAHMHELFAGTRKTLDVQFAIRTRQGGVRHWSFSASAPGTMVDGRRFMVGMAVDVTDRQQAEEALLKSEQRFRLSLAAARMGIWTLDVATGIQMRDDNLNAMLGLEARDTTQPFDEFLTHIHPDDRAAVRAAFAVSTQEGQPLRVEFRVVRPDGSILWLRDQGDVFGVGGGAGHMAGACVDVTERKQMEDELREARNSLEVRVVERTADLERAMDALEAEMGQRRVLVQRLGTAQEEERRRLSRDLHDTAGQLLAGLSLAFKAIETDGKLPPPTASRFIEAQKIMNDLGKELHSLSVRLRPTSLDDMGLEPALGQLVSDWAAQNGVQADFHGPGSTSGRLPAEIETAVYRVVQEALTNITKHAEASIVSVVATRPDGQVSVVIEDDGIGFDLSSAPKIRLGMLGMRERVEQIGGKIEIESSPGSGTTVAVQIPLTPARSAS